MGRELVRVARAMEHRAAEAADEAKRKAAVAAAALEREQPGEGPTRPTLPAASSDDGGQPTRRPRVKAGIVAQYDMHGNRVM